MNVVDLSSAKLNDVFQLPKEEALKVFYERIITIPITARTSLKKELVVNNRGRSYKRGFYSIWLALWCK